MLFEGQMEVYGQSLVGRRGIVLLEHDAEIELCTRSGCVIGQSADIEATSVSIVVTLLIVPDRRLNEESKALLTPTDDVHLLVKPITGTIGRVFIGATAQRTISVHDVDIVDIILRVKSLGNVVEIGLAKGKIRDN